MARVTSLPLLQHRFRGFALDDFQAEALYQLDCGNSVLLAAPTGTGKTLVADYLVTKVLQAGQRLAYTAPIKALVNQKFRGFAREFGRAADRDPDRRHSPESRGTGGRDDDGDPP